ncbi:hypothetical protein EVAR_2269_1 [Eumeta japonica]|uniref:Uncharacterized protein n=1 Tax=Eumeta variegata TaxID=151549 RepID=A0A4C1SIK8_EUMVA|nr:hypothetical protein EVAR_2269_1 [Eumeta japonica]
MGGSPEGYSLWTIKSCHLFRGQLLLKRRRQRQTPPQRFVGNLYSESEIKSFAGFHQVSGARALSPPAASFGRET